MTNTKKKSAKEKRILVASIIVAATIVAGSTFAWFTSKDEVTNRLSASAKYDVSIAEDFQPPEEWVPGQTINKDVSAVNTGNVDAFVRMWLGGQMRLLNEDTPSVDATTNVSFTAVSDQKLIDLGLTYGAGNNVYYRELSQKQIDNPKDEANKTAADEDTNQPATFSEVQSVQAGGVLVYAPEKAGYTWELEQATELPIYTGGTATMTNVAKGTKVGTGNSTATNKITATDTNYFGAIDASTFKPETTGLYIFRRNVAETADGTENKYEYSGYYYDATLKKYFALHNEIGANGHSDYVLPEGTINDNSTATPSKDQVLPVTINEGKKVYLYTASEKVINTGSTENDLKWTYDATNKKFVVTYGTGDKAVSIDVNLDNIGDGAEAWTAISGTTADHTTTFYYNNDVEAGDSTTKLVDSVKLSENTKNGAYLAFDFDLDVFLDSVQVTMDEAGNENFEPVKDGWTVATGDTATAAKAEATVGAPEINTITWTAAN